jgi:integrase
MRILDEQKLQRRRKEQLADRVHIVCGLRRQHRKFTAADLRAPAERAPMKCTVQQINKLIERIRSRQQPELPEGVREKHYHDPALPGFYIRLLRTGVASWVVQWTKLGRQKKITLGNVLVLDRVDAIKAAKDMLAKIQLSLLDPHKARREYMRATKLTFASVVPVFMKRKKSEGLRPSTEKAWNLYFNGYYLKPLHNLPIDEITSQLIQTQIDIIADRSGNVAADLCRSALNVLFKWLDRTGKLPEGHRNPMDRVQAPVCNPPRVRTLSDDEIRLIWNACEAWEAKAIQQHHLKEIGGKNPLGSINDPEAPRSVKLLFLTGCRLQEIGSLHWSEVDLDNAEVHIHSRRKGEVELHVPLADWAVRILRGQRRNDETYVLAPRKPRKPRRVVPGVNLSGVNKRIDRRIVEAGGTPPPDWTAHDIRRTFRTKLSQLGVTADVAEALVGHVAYRSTIIRTYDRYNYWPEMRDAIGKWETHLRAVIDGTAEKIAYPRFGERKKGGTT